MRDVVIIGAGIVGNAVARELSKYNLNIIVIEKEDDLACGASKANSGIVHAGYDCVPGTLKAKLNVEGVKMYSTLVKELDIPYRNNGSLVLCFDENDRQKLSTLYDYGIKNGVSGMKILTAAETLNMEPNVSHNVKGALYVATAGVISPYEAAIAFAENAAVNGVEFWFNTEVTNLSKDGDCYTISTNNGELQAKAVVNAAGVFSDLINNCVSDEKAEILPQRGQYYLLDNLHSDFVSKTIFQLPTALGKGVLITSTVDKNILIGPNAENDCNKEDRETTLRGLNEVFNTALLSFDRIPIRDKITEFSGIRSKISSKDFIINEPEKGFVNALGIDSPGLSAAPAIGAKIADIVLSRLEPKQKTDFIKTREGIIRFKDLSYEEKREIFEKDNRYGNVICRCETVTEAEIVDAITRPLGAKTLDGVKRRTRAQMGRCQGGFCSIRIMEILSRELGLDEADVTKFGRKSWVIM